MERTYAAELDADNIVLRVIVGTAAWATEMLGGVWVDCEPCGPGWVWVDGEMVPPEAPDHGDVTDELDDLLPETD